MPLAKPTRRRPSPPTRAINNDLFVSRSTPSRWLIPKHKGVTKLPLAVSVAAFLTVIAVSVGTLAATSMERDDRMLRADLAEGQQRLLARLERLEKLCTPVVATPSDTGNTAPALPVTVTAKDLTDLRSVIDTNNWNTEAATETIEYRHRERNVLMRLPYNPKWGNTMYKVAPFEVNGDTIQYGPIIVANGFHRAFTLTVTPSRDVAAIRQEAQKATATVKITSVGVNDFQIYRVEQGTDTPSSLEFIGRRQNYIFSKTSTDPANSSQVAPTVNEVLPIIRSLLSI